MTIADKGRGLLPDNLKDAPMNELRAGLIDLLNARARNVETMNQVRGSAAYKRGDLKPYTDREDILRSAHRTVCKIIESRTNPDNLQTSVEVDV